MNAWIQSDQLVQISERTLEHWHVPSIQIAMKLITQLMLNEGRVFLDFLINLEKTLEVEAPCLFLSEFIRRISESRIVSFQDWSCKNGTVKNAYRRSILRCYAPELDRLSDHQQQTSFSHGSCRKFHRKKTKITPFICHAGWRYRPGR